MKSVPQRMLIYTLLIIQSGIAQSSSCSPFSYRKKSITPQSLLQQCIGAEFSGTIMVTNTPTSLMSKPLRTGELVCTNDGRYALVHEINDGRCSLITKLGAIAEFEIHDRTTILRFDPPRALKDLSILAQFLST